MVKASSTNQELYNDTNVSGVNAISSHTMGPRVSISPGNIDMNITKSDSIKLVSNIMQGFYPKSVEPVAWSCKHTSELEENVDMVETMLSYDVSVYKCKTYKTLNKHIKTQHKGHRECSICEITFNSEDNLNAQNTGMLTDGELREAIDRILEPID